MLGEVLPFKTVMMSGANDCNNGQADFEILGRGSPGVTMMVMGANSKGELSSRTFLVLHPTSSKKNINDDSDEGGTLVESPTPGSMEDDVVMTFTLAIAGEGRVVVVAPDRLLG